MSVAILVLAAVLVFVIAAVTVGREARRLDALPPRPIYDPDEAVEAVADALPASAQAELTHDDVRQLLAWHLEEFRARGLRPRYEGEAPPELVVLDDESMLDLLVERALTSGRDLDPVHVAAVLDRHLRYLEQIGAIASTPVPPDELGPAQGA